MALDTDKFTVPDGAPAGGVQKMKSVTFGETLLEMQNANYKFPVTDGNAGDAITSDGSGGATFQPIPKASSIDSEFSNVTSTPPDSGTFRINNADEMLATIIYLHEIDSNGDNRGTFIGFAIKPGNILVLQSRSTPANFVAYDVVTNTDNGTYDSLAVNFIETSGAGLVDGDIYTISVLSGTGSVAETSSMQSGAISTQQTAPPPTRGMVWNNPTQDNATNLFISHESLQGVSNQQLLDVAGQVDSTVTLVQVGKPDNYQVWLITSVTPESGYVNYGVSFVASNGGNFVNLTTIAVGINSPGTVSTDATIAGDGSGSNPLSVVPSSPKHSTQTLTFDATQDWDVSVGTMATLNLSGNCTFDAPSNLQVGGEYVLILNTSSFNVTSWDSVFAWVGGNAPVLPASSKVVIVFKYDGTDLMGVMNGGFS